MLDLGAALSGSDPKAPSRLRPDGAIWLYRVVLKAVALDARQCLETAEELVCRASAGG